MGQGCCHNARSCHGVVTLQAVGQELASSVEQIILLEASRTKLQGELMAAQQEGAKARMQLQTCEQLAEEDRAELERTR